jgi:hypothetical protein
MPMPNSIGEPFDASAGVRRSTLRAALILAVRFVDDRERAPPARLSIGSCRAGQNRQQHSPVASFEIGSRHNNGRTGNVA